MKSRQAMALLGLLIFSFEGQAANIVARGSDLLEIDPAATLFFGETFEGVPLGLYDFDADIGVQNVGSTAVIVRRVAPAVAGPGNSDTVPTVVDAFQIRSAEPVSLMGGPLGIYYITLQSARGGPVSAGTMTINFGPEGDPHGTFSSSFDLYVDVRLNSLSGPILDSRLIEIADSGSVPWRHEPTGSIQIPGVNILLNEHNFENDFWFEGNVSKVTPNGMIGARNPVPELGGTLPLLGFALLGLTWANRLAFSRR